MCLKGLKIQFSIADILLLLLAGIILVTDVEFIGAVANSTAQAENFFTRSVLIIVPVFYIPFNFKLINEHLNKNGGELLYVYYKNVIWWLLTFLVIYSLIIIPGFVVAFMQFELTYETVLIYYFTALICCILFLGIIYMFSFMTKSIIITMLITCIYFVLCVFGYREDTWWNFYTSDIIDISSYEGHYLRIWGLSLIFVAAGFIFNEKNEKMQ